MINSSLRPKEYYRINGSLPDGYIEVILDEHDMLRGVQKNLESIDDVYTECCTGYCTSDEFIDILKQIDNMIDNTKSKALKDGLREIYEMIQDKQDELYNQGEYCKEQFTNLIKCLKGGSK